MGVKISSWIPDPGGWQSPCPAPRHDARVPFPRTRRVPCVSSGRFGRAPVGYVEAMREKVLRELAGRAATDLEFLEQLRRDPEGALARHGYELTGEELGALEEVQRRTAGMSDEELARMLGNPGVSPARPAAPGARGAG